VIDRDAVVALCPARSSLLGIGYEVLEFRIRQFVAIPAATSPSSSICVSSSPSGASLVEQP
jgi:hypothetical protein